MTEENSKGLKSMKFKLITIILLSFSLAACAEKEPQSKAADDDGPWWDREKVCGQIEREPYPFNFTYTFIETGGKQQFSRPITEEERNQFYNFSRDHMDEVYLGKKERFNRKRPEPKFSPTETYKKEQKIKALLDECVTLVGPEEYDKNYELDLQDGVFNSGTNYHSNDKEFFFKTEPHYLTGRMKKCERAVYPYPEGYTRAYGAPCAAVYDISDFEYSTSDMDTPEEYKIKYWNPHSAKYINRPSRTEAKAKRTILEKKYEIIYLNVRAAGLLRAIDYTYYPKSFLRAHADQVGLTKYIQQEEKKTGHKLQHDVLAKEYFGSYEKWVTSLDKFLDQKTIQMKIGAK